ncbi:hypothetical protein ACFL0L_05175 [Patescibacteria group bacterium]
MKVFVKKRYIVPLLSIILWVIMFFLPVGVLVSNSSYDWDGTRLVLALEDEKNYELEGESTIIQSFIARHDGVSEIKLPMENLSKSQFTVLLVIKDAEDLSTVREESIESSLLINNGYYEWQFDPIRPSKNHEFLFTIQIDEPGGEDTLAVRVKATDVYENGLLLAPENEAEDLVFDFRYQTSSSGEYLGLLWERLQMYKPPFLQGGWLVTLIALWAIGMYLVVFTLVSLFFKKDDDNGS